MLFAIISAATMATVATSLKLTSSTGAIEIDLDATTYHYTIKVDEWITNCLF